MWEHCLVLRKCYIYMNIYLYFVASVFTYTHVTKSTRVFERRYGSHKFASCLVASQVLTTVLEVLTILTLQWLAIDLHSGGFLPPGPWVFVCFWQQWWFFCIFIFIFKKLFCQVQYCKSKVCQIIKEHWSF